VITNKKNNFIKKKVFDKLTQNARLQTVGLSTLLASKIIVSLNTNIFIRHGLSVRKEENQLDATA